MYTGTFDNAIIFQWIIHAMGKSKKKKGNLHSNLI